MKKKLTLKQKKINKALGIQKRKQKLKKSVKIKIINPNKKPLPPDESGILIMPESDEEKIEFARKICNRMNRKVKLSTLISMIGNKDLDFINGFSWVEDYINNHCMIINISINFKLGSDFIYLSDYISSNRELRGLKFIEY